MHTVRLIAVALTSLLLISCTASQERRTGRVDRRQDRMDYRTEGRTERHEVRAEREDARAAARFDSW